jgi:REP element-mobilizing transposase RayT
MACYLFTFHTYGSWMPDRPQGCVRRGHGIQTSNVQLAEAYRSSMTQDAVALTREQQQWILAELQVASTHQDWRLHAVAVVPTHVHVLVSWRSYRPHGKVSTAIKQSLTRRLNREAGQRTWFGRCGSRKRITDRRHFDHLVETYLPRHKGVFWRET